MSEVGGRTDVEVNEAACLFMALFGRDRGVGECLLLGQERKS
jgi:hypothetical protein